MTLVERTELAELARAASPGPWHFDSYSRIWSNRSSDESPWDWYEMRFGEARVPYPTNRPLLWAEATLAQRRQLHDYWLNYAVAFCLYEQDPLIADVPALSGDTAVGIRRRDAEFIAAANPVVVLALLGALTTIERERDSMANVEKVMALVALAQSLQGGIYDLSGWCVICRAPHETHDVACPTARARVILAMP